MSILNDNERWGYFRHEYKRELPAIMEASRRHKVGRISPYFIDWVRYFTPIEEIAWGSIRYCGLPVYPQFPVLNYFVDFANPYYKIGIELDGKEWHDAVKDPKRDARLAEQGWLIFRITGRECYLKYETPCELFERDASEDKKQEAIEHWLLNTCDGVITSINNIFFRDDPDAYGGLCRQSVEAHCGVSFATWNLK